MARRAGATTSTQAGPSQAKGDAPSSTLAAKIVENRSKTLQQQQPDGTDLFRRLLQEYLTDPSIEESNIETNAKLIQVVAEAGLDTVVRDDLFSRENRMQQTKDSIAVICLTVERIPGVLFHSDTTTSDSSSLPLFLILLPKVLSLFGRPHLEPIQEDLSKLLGKCISAGSKGTSSWQAVDGVVAVLQSCVEDTLDALEALADSHGENQHVLEFSVPTARGIALLAPGAEESIVLPRGAQAHVVNPTHASSIILGLLRSFGKDYQNADELPRLTLSTSVDICYQLCSSLVALSRKPLALNTAKSLQSLCETVFFLVSHQDRSCITASSRTLLCHIMASLLGVQPRMKDLTLQQSACRLLIALARESDRCPKFRKSFVELVVPLIRRITNNEDLLSTMEHDLKLLICSLAFKYISFSSEKNCSTSARQCIVDLMHTGPSFMDPGIQIMFKSLSVALPMSDQENSARPSKRRRTDETVTGVVKASRRTSILSTVFNKLAGPEDEKFVGLHKNPRFIERFANLEVRDQEDIIRSLGELPCLVGDFEDVTRCPICHSLAGNEPASDPESIEAAEMIKMIVKWPRFPRLRKLRVQAMVALKHLVNHGPGLFTIDSTESDGSLSQWCFRSLQSSCRELRVAAGRSIPAFLRHSVPAKVRKANRMQALKILNHLTERKVLEEQETLILAWAQVARVCGEDELNIVLLRLVDFLGHSHSLLYGVAFDEILRLAEYKNCTLEELFKPYWRTVAVEVIKDVQSRPQKAQHLCELLSISVSRFLLQTQAETIPYLVLTQNRDILQRIASARDIAIRDVCLKHLAMILSALLLQNFPNPDQEILRILCVAAPEFQEADVLELIRLEPIPIACEMLKVAGEKPASEKPSAHQAFTTFVGFMERKQPQAKPSSKANQQILANFLESHILGIMTHFSEIIDARNDVHSVTGKVRCIRAMNEMISLAGPHFNFGMAVPQIRACLQYALDDPDLCDEAFCAWTTLLGTVEEEDVDALLEHSFAVVVRTWNSLSDESHNLAYSMIANLVKKFNNLLKEKILRLPSLGSVAMLSKFASEIAKLREGAPLWAHFDAFAQRCSDENKVVVEQALTELRPFLEENQTFIHDSAVSAQPNIVISQLSRSLLDASIRFLEESLHISALCAECLGIIGCMDPNRVEAVREKHEVMVLSNFERVDETVDFVAYLLENILVKAFRSAATGRVQNYLAYAMQELLKHSEFKMAIQRPRSSQPSVQNTRWMSMSESARSTLIPYFNTRYLIAKTTESPGKEYPIFKTSLPHATWLRYIVADLLQRGKGDNPQLFFPVLARVIHGHDLSIPNFLLPFTMLNVILGGTEQEVLNIETELLCILQCDLRRLSAEDADNVKRASENVFQVLDYLLRWYQQKRNLYVKTSTSNRITLNSADYDEVQEASQMSAVDRIISAIPPNVIAKRATECRSYARALFHWEQYIREQKTRGVEEQEEGVLLQMQGIYESLEEPDGIEGISCFMKLFDPDQQVLNLRRDGKWAAAQTWYELDLEKSPDKETSQLGLLSCLRETGQLDSLLRFVQNRIFSGEPLAAGAHALAVEACWSTGQWEALETVMNNVPQDVQSNFKIGLGACFLALRNQNFDKFGSIAATLREDVAKSLTASNITSLSTCHRQLLNFHILYEIERLNPVPNPDGLPLIELDKVLPAFDSRLNILASSVADKQYLLGIRRAAMRLSCFEFTGRHHANAWLTSARLARKSDLGTVAYDAVNRASKFDHNAALLEQARLLFKDGNHKKAIQTLQGAIDTKVFHSYEPTVSVTTSLTIQNKRVNEMKAKAELLLAKWADHAGQAKSDDLLQLYHRATHNHSHWEKGHYYLGRHYNKILEYERTLPVSRQSDRLRAGEDAKQVIDNYLRSLAFGAKYCYQTIPKILTLWLDFAQEVHADMAKGCSFGATIGERRKRYLEHMHKQLKKYVADRVQPWALYTALPQVMSRIGHPHPRVWDVLTLIVLRISAAFPQQALWSLLAVAKSTAADKSMRAKDILNALKQDPGKRSALTVAQLRTLIVQGNKLTEALLHACEINVDARSVHVSLTKDLQFNTKLVPCGLVVPIEKTMTAVLPTANANIKEHKAFPYGNVTIESFTDDVLVLSSLQRPRKINVRGSDGQHYGLLCKPKDDLRKDQRLMEFNAMIERSLKRDVEASKRRLYVKTYGVVPLNEECGTIEWVDGLKPMRDIIIGSYKAKGIRIDYAEIRSLLAEACDDAPHKHHVFADKILPKFPPVLHEWFVDMFPEPEAWHAARLRYTRSCAVMSIVGHVLGLGDRHGENVLLEDGSGGVFHVDFNCLFDKGLTFEKPERVPFRLTHNMVDAMGSCGVEGPFRKSAEVTLQVLRQHEDTLMTILETFLYDPTADFLGSTKKKRSVPGVPETPQEVLDSVRSKLRGLMHGEKIPLGVQGYVAALIDLATDHGNLAEMYIGWCAFF